MILPDNRTPILPVPPVRSVDTVSFALQTIVSPPGQKADARRLADSGTLSAYLERASVEGMMIRTGRPSSLPLSLNKYDTARSLETSTPSP
jgi:hypothetical protein